MSLKNSIKINNTEENVKAILDKPTNEGTTGTRIGDVEAELSTYKEELDTKASKTDVETFGETVMAYLSELDANTIKTSDNYITIGENAKTYSENSIAVGENVVAGQKAYWHSGVTNGNTFTIVADKSSLKSEPVITPEWEVGDVISYTNADKHYNCATITAINGNKVTVDKSLSDVTFTYDDGWDGNCIWVVAKPNVGMVDIGICASAQGGSYKSTESTYAGAYANARGRNTKAIGHYSDASGRSNIASGMFSQVTGLGNTASGNKSTAKGQGTTASGDFSNSSGESTTASGKWSTAMGYQTTAEGRLSIATGARTTAMGYQSLSGGYKTEALGENSISWGSGAQASGSSSFSLGNNTIASADFCVAFGKDTTSSGNYSVATGISSTASGLQSVAMGSGCVASGEKAVALGHNSKSTGKSSFTANELNEASGTQATAFGYNNKAIGSNSIATGAQNKSNGYISTATGWYSQANGQVSFTAGTKSIANGDNQFVQGKYNIPDNNNEYAHIVGNGKDDNNLSNAYTLDWDGNAFFAGEVRVGTNSSLHRLAKYEELENLGIKMEDKADKTEVPSFEGLMTEEIFENGAESNKVYKIGENDKFVLDNYTPLSDIGSVPVINSYGYLVLLEDLGNNVYSYDYHMQTEETTYRQYLNNGFTLGGYVECVLSGAKHSVKVVSYDETTNIIQLKFNSEKDSSDVNSDPDPLLYIKSINAEYKKGDLIYYDSDLRCWNWLVSAADIVENVSATTTETFTLAPEMHRVTFRGKNLGTSVTAAQKAAIKDGSFDDLFLGDYWVINDVTWRIVDMDYWYNTGYGENLITTHHLVIMPDTVLYTAVMNSDYTTAGGYVGSKMYTTNLAQAKTTITSAFGDMVLTHEEALSNEITDGVVTGISREIISVALPNEIMMYGTNIFSPINDGSLSFQGYTLCKTQLALFVIAPKFITTRSWYWLRDVVSSDSFAFVDDAGNAVCNGSANGGGVRPYFLIG